jgi:hypothetical protein
MQDAAPYVFAMLMAFPTYNLHDGAQYKISIHMREASSLLRVADKQIILVIKTQRCILSVYEY